MATPPSVDLPTIDALIDRALAEDVGTGDVTTLATVPAGQAADAYFLAKEDGILAGLAVAERVFAALSPQLALTWTKADGDAVETGTRFGTVEGPVRPLLTGERLRLARLALDRLLGRHSTEDMLDALFGRFCIGK